MRILIADNFGGGCKKKACFFRKATIVSGKTLVGWVLFYKGLVFLGLKFFLFFLNYF